MSSMTISQNTAPQTLSRPQAAAPSSAPTTTAATPSVGNLEGQTGAASAPGDSGRVTDTQGHTARLALNEGAGGPTGTIDNKAAAAKTYDQWGNKPSSLATDQGRRTLMASSPQVDNNDKTTHDGERCGGAALTNAMIADGAYAKNAGAIEKTAKDLDVNMTDDQKKAVAAMKSGTMTPAQAAQVQELMVDLAKNVPANNGVVPYKDGEGISAGGMTMLSTRLKANGAFSNSDSVSFTMQQRPDGGGKHWTMTQNDKKGWQTSVNSWPNEFGFSDIKNEQIGPRPTTDNGQRNPNWAGDVTLYNMKDGQTYTDLRMAGKTPAQDLELRQTGRYPIGDVPGMDRVDPSWH